MSDSNSSFSGIPVRTSNQHRAQIHRSSRWLRRARRVLVALHYSLLVGDDLTTAEKNALLDALAATAIRGGLYATPAAYNEDNPNCRKFVRCGLMGHCRWIWQKAEAETVGDPSWAWHTFCKRVNYYPVTGGAQFVESAERKQA